MATFEAQVEGLTSLAIDGSSAPTQSELTQFLTDGAAEVINSMPRRLKFLCATEDTFTSTAVGSEAKALTSGQVLSVTRSDGTIDQPCREIPAALRGRVSDGDDMNAATTSDPVYYIYNGNINALPASGSCKYLEVNNPSVLYTASNIDNFPNEYEYLVPLYAAVKALTNKINSLGKTDLDTSSISAPSAPSLDTISGGSVSPITVGTIAKADISGDVPTYTKPQSSVDFTSLVPSGSDSDGFDDFVSSEDVEMASISLQKQQELLRAYQIDIQNELNDFNEKNAKYQANVQAELAKHNSDLQAELRQAQLDGSDAQQESAQALQAAIQNNDDKIQKFSAEINKYSAQINDAVQEFSQNLSNNQQQITFYSQQQAKLQADYDKGVQIMRGG